MDDQVEPPDPGDVGRRVARRRQELGLSRKQLAEAAGMSPGYVEYLEERPAEVTPNALLRLAQVLQVSVAFLLGEGVGLPPGRGGAGSHPVFETLSTEECDGLLSPGGVGRVVLVGERGPVAIPVNFSLLDGDVVFRTAAGSSAAAADGQEVGFEVDRIDDAMREGWSVLVTGRARRLVDPEEMARARALGVEPWAGGDRDVYLRLTPDQVSGRRIRVEG
jgi:nitroimidazol reductase NimA-like FMN-containing flavoprotein (pyridoxamine 5'-phosphate oxidase superfamily)/plasmid maintenance system antidote protein VapI